MRLSLSTCLQCLPQCVPSLLSICCSLREAVLLIHGFTGCSAYLAQNQQKWTRGQYQSSALLTSLNKHRHTCQCTHWHVHEQSLAQQPQHVSICTQSDGLRWGEPVIFYSIYVNCIFNKNKIKIVKERIKKEVYLCQRKQRGRRLALRLVVKLFQTQISIDQYTQMV